MKKRLLIGLILLGTILQLITVFRSGSSCLKGICFWGPNGHDGVWHLALANQFQKGAPPPAPTFAGERMKNYHWGYDLLVWLVHKVAPIPVTDLHFRLFPLIFSLSLGVLSFKLATLIEDQFWVGFWFVFLNYLANSLGWVVSLIRDGSLGGESLFWAMQSISFLLNPPFALSVIVLFLGLYLWKKWEKKLSLSKIFILGIIFGSLLNIKAYASVLFFLSLATTIGLEIVINRQIEREKILILLSSGLISGLIWFFWQRGSGWPFVFQPFWFIRTLFEAKDRLFIPKLGQIWWILADSWLASPRFWFLVGGGTLIFFVGNFNTRLLGLVKGIIVKKKRSHLEWMFWGIIFWGATLPLFFIQKGTAWNTIQFLYYSLLFANWFLAQFLADLTEKRHWVKLVLVVIPLLPANYGTLKDYFGFPPPAIIPREEVEGLEFLSSQPGKTVLTFPFDQYQKLGREAPLPLYLYESTAYVSAFSGKVSFLEDEMNLEITGFPWRERKKEVTEFFNSKDPIWARGFLLNNRIDYIYLVDQQQLPLEPEKLGVKMIFENEKVRIYQVLK